MTKPTLTNMITMGEMFIQKYESYLPSAFDESFTLLQKVNKVIHYLNEIGKITNDVVTQWNEVMAWVMEEGLNESVVTKIDELVANGTFNDLIVSGVFPSFDARLVEVEKKNELFAEYVSVDQYPRLAGETDDAPRINRALNDAKTVFLPTGVYSIKDTIYTKIDGQTIYGSGFTTIIQNDSEKSEVLGLQKASIIVQHQHVVIRDLAIYGDQTLDNGGLLEKKATGHNIYFAGDKDYYGLVEHVLIKNGYVGVTVENKARHVTFKKVSVYNCEHGLQVYNASDVTVEDFFSGTEAFRGSLGWVQRNITLHSGARNVKMRNVRLENGDTVGIYFRHEEGATGDLQNNENIEIDNLYIKGKVDGLNVPTDPYAGIYFEEASANYETNGVKITNLTLVDVVNAIHARGSSDASGITPRKIKNVSITNLKTKNCTNVFSYGGTGYNTNTVGFENLKVLNVDGDSSVKVKGENCFLENITLSNNGEIITVGNVYYKNFAKNGVKQKDNKAEISNLLVGSKLNIGTESNKGVMGLDIVTGTTGAGTTTVSYPIDYLPADTICIGWKIQKSNGVWQDMYKYDLTLSSIAYGASSITLTHPNNTDYASRPYLLLLAKGN